MAQDIHTTYPIVDCTLLKKCALWEGSDFAFWYSFWGVSLASVQAKIHSFQQLDDLTPKEQELLQAMIETVRIATEQQ